MPTTASKLKSGTLKSMDYETLLRRVSERVWEIMRDEARRERERTGKGRRR